MGLRKLADESEKLVTDLQVEKAANILALGVMTGELKYAAYQDATGVTSDGFCFTYIFTKTFHAVPSVFYELVKIDKEIGWLNRDHAELIVFQFKAMEIILDEQVINYHKIDARFKMV